MTRLASAHGVAAIGGSAVADIAPTILENVQRLARGWFSFLPGKKRQNGVARVTQQDQLASLAATLSGIAQETEPDFVELAGDLQELYTCAVELGQSTATRIESVRDAIAQSRLTGDEGLVSISARELKSALAHASRNVESLVAVTGALQRLHGHGNQLERIARVLRASGCSFAVESARSEACQSAFGAFVVELRQLAARIGEVGETIAAHSNSTNSELQQHLREISQDIQKLGELSAQSESAVLQTCGEVQQVLDRSLGALHQAAGHTNAIRRHADEAIYHIQFGDIVRQKLEHVSEALDQAAQLSGSSVGSAKDRGVRDAELDSLLAVQSGQLEQIIAEVESGRDKLSAAFTGLANESGELLADLRGLDGGAFASDAGANLFAGLEHDLTQLEKWQLQGRDLSTKARHTARRAGEASRRLTSHLEQVRAVNRAMHLQAINAIVKTVLLGTEGETLGVLSAQVHSVFQDSSAVAGETVCVLEQITTGTIEADGDTAAAEQTSSGALSTGLARLRAAYAGIHDSAETAGAHAEQQSARLAHAREQLDFLAALADRMRALNDEIGAVRATLRPAKLHGHSLEKLQSLIGGYTMESEREILRRVVSGDTAPAPAAQTATGDDNIEMF